MNESRKVGRDKEGGKLRRRNESERNGKRKK
jgi:hypothetical protein